MLKEDSLKTCSRAKKFLERKTYVQQRSCSPIPLNTNPFVQVPNILADPPALRRVQPPTNRPNTQVVPENMYLPTPSNHTSLGTTMLYSRQESVRPHQSIISVPANTQSLYSTVPLNNTQSMYSNASQDIRPSSSASHLTNFSQISLSAYENKNDSIYSNFAGGSSVGRLDPSEAPPMPAHPVSNQDKLERTLATLESGRPLSADSITPFASATAAMHQSALPSGQSLPRGILKRPALIEHQDHPRSSVMTTKSFQTDGTLSMFFEADSLAERDSLGMFLDNQFEDMNLGKYEN